MSQEAGRRRLEDAHIIAALEIAEEGGGIVVCSCLHCCVAGVSVHLFAVTAGYVGMHAEVVRKVKREVKTMEEPPKSQTYYQVVRNSPVRVDRCTHKPLYRTSRASSRVRGQVEGAVACDCCRRT